MDSLADSLRNSADDLESTTCMDGVTYHGAQWELDCSRRQWRKFGGKYHLCGFRVPNEKGCMSQITDCRAMHCLLANNFGD